jgi:serine/threonine protein kinase
MNLNSGTLLRNGSYRIISTLGRGGFGITYLAEQILAKRKVCVKEFFPKDYFRRDDGVDSISILSEGHATIMAKFRDKFIKEAQTIASLSHPNIIHIIDVFEENNTAYYIMEYVEGGSLSDLVKERGPLSEADAVRYIKDVAIALGHIHEHKINHLDVKPGNVMVRTKDDTAILIDFGLSKHYDEMGDQTSSTPVGISNGYAPMEQYNAGGVNTFSPSTDIYSLGATLYTLVTGKVPPVASVVGEDGVGALPEHLSSGVVKAICQSMSYWRKDRPQSIEEFIALIDAGSTSDRTILSVDSPKIAEDLTISVNPAVVGSASKPSRSAQSKPKGRRLWIWLAVVIALVGVGVALLFLMESDSMKSSDKQAQADGSSLAENLYDAIMNDDIASVDSLLVLFVELPTIEQNACYDEYANITNERLIPEASIACRIFIASAMNDQSYYKMVENEFNKLSEEQCQECSEYIDYIIATFVGDIDEEQSYDESDLDDLAQRIFYAGLMGGDSAMSALEEEVANLTEEDQKILESKIQSIALETLGTMFLDE